MGLRYIEANVGIFLNLMQIKPPQFYTTSLFLALNILGMDETGQSAKKIKELNQIKEQTHEDLNIRLAKAEAIVDSRPLETWGKPLEDLLDNNGKRIRINGKPINILDLYMYLKESYQPMLEAVSSIAKDYTMEIKFNLGGNGGNPEWANKLES